MPSAMASQDWGLTHDMLSLPLSLQDRSIQPEFQDRQTHASCVQRVGQQTSLALESSDIQPALQRGPQCPGLGPVPTTVPSAPVRQGGDGGLGRERERERTECAQVPLSSQPLPHPAAAPASPTPVAHGTSGSRVGSRGRGCFQWPAGGGHLTCLSPCPGFFRLLPLALLPSLCPFLLFSFLPHFPSTASTAGCQPPSRIDSAKSLLSVFAPCYWWACLACSPGLHPNHLLLAGFMQLHATKTHHSPALVLLPAPPLLVGGRILIRGCGVGQDREYLPPPLLRVGGQPGGA